MIQVNAKRGASEVGHELPVVLDRTVAGRSVEIYQCCNHVVSEFLGKRHKTVGLSYICVPLKVYDSVPLRGNYIILVVDDLTEMYFSNVSVTIDHHTPSVMTRVEHGVIDSEIESRRRGAVNLKRG